MPAGKFNIDVVYDVTLAGRTEEKTLGTIQWSNPHGFMDPAEKGQYLFLPNTELMTTAEMVSVAAAMIKLAQ